MKRITKIDEETSKCDICNHIFTDSVTEERMADHMRIQHKIVDNVEDEE
jgi:hypothetical protein